MTKQEMLLKVASLERSPLFLANVCAATRMAMKKTASPVSDVVGAGLTGAIPYLGNTINGFAGIAGMASDPTTEAEEAEMDRNGAKGFIPGVGQYRTERRLKRQLTDDQGNRPHYWSQNFGPLTSTLLAGGLGAGIGAGIGGAAGGNLARGAKYGLYGGIGAAGLAGLISAISAGITRRRTKDEQKAYANSGTAAEWLVPGAAGYGRLKSIGRAQGDAEDRIKA